MPSSPKDHLLNCTRTLSKVWPDPVGVADNTFTLTKPYSDDLSPVQVKEAASVKFKPAAVARFNASMFVVKPLEMLQSDSMIRTAAPKWDIISLK